MHNYWKIKSAALESELRLLELRKVADEIIERKRIVFEEAGLDPTKKCKFDDETESINEE